MSSPIWSGSEFAVLRADDGAKPAVQTPVSGWSNVAPLTQRAIHERALAAALILSQASRSAPIARRLSPRARSTSASSADVHSSLCATIASATSARSALPPSGPRPGHAALRRASPSPSSQRQAWSRAVRRRNARKRSIRDPASLRRFLALPGGKPLLRAGFCRVLSSSVSTCLEHDCYGP
jgi:hypothetical protein